MRLPVASVDLDCFDRLHVRVAGERYRVDAGHELDALTGLVARGFAVDVAPDAVQFVITSRLRVRRLPDESANVQARLTIGQRLAGIGGPVR